MATNQKEESNVYLHKTKKMNEKLLADKQRKPLLTKKPAPVKKDKEEENNKNKEQENQKEKEKNEKEKEKEEKENKRRDKLKRKAARELAKEKKRLDEKELKYLQKKYGRLEQENHLLSFNDINICSKQSPANKDNKLCHVTRQSEETCGIEQSDADVNSKNYLAYTIFHDMTLYMRTEGNDPKSSAEVALCPIYKNNEEIENLVKAKVAIAESLFNTVFQIYNPKNVMIAFNGGKNSTVVLHLLEQYFQKNHCLKNIKIPSLYVEDTEAFPEIIEFVNDCTKFFHIELIKKPGPIEKAFDAFSAERPHIEAVFMGSRTNDFAIQNLKVMQATSTNPFKISLMRINPVLQWTCRDIWQYIYVYNVPYCVLYQQGYTSLGNRKDTIPNPHLKVVSSCTGRIIRYRPGHEILDNDELERAGRQ